jgi:hypothetical protein
MATILSTQTVRASTQRVVWQWVDSFGKVYGLHVNHIPVGADPQAFADAAEAADLASLTAAEIAANLDEVAGG